MSARLPRVLVTLAVTAAVLAAGITGLIWGGVAVLGHLTSAQAAPLPPLAPAPLEPSTVYADDGTTVLATFHASARRIPVALDQISPNLIHAVLDTEDERFYIHGGFDIPSTIRALASDSSADGGLQGGSTLTQQLVKQTYLSSKRQISRKVKEAVLASRLQKKYTKNQILNAYLNTIYLGDGAYGVEAAANTYFDVPASQLTVAEGALLAGMIQNPNGYDPVLDAAAARTRRAEVLARMVHYHTITQAAADAANATPLPTTASEPAPPSPASPANSFYVQQVEDQLLGPSSPLGDTYSERYEQLFEGGLKIYTNFDPGMQESAEAAIAEENPLSYDGFDESMVTIEPGTGKVRALVNENDDQQFDVVTQGLRQPGSGFKVFTLLAALEKGYNINDTINGSSPCAVNFPGDGGPGGPGPGNSSLLDDPIHNDEGNGGGIETLTTATAQSTNCAYIRLAHEVGLPAVVDMAHAMGISEPLVGKGDQYYPSMVIGALGVKPIEMAAAYATVADGGVYYAPQWIDHVVDRTGTTIYTAKPAGKQVVSPAIAAEATQAFQQVLVSGTAAGKGLDRESAGKTGTTENSQDAWFNGYTPNLETTVWMGNPNNEVSMGSVVGGEYPASTWHYAMERDVQSLPTIDFPPAGALGPSTYITSASLQRDDQSAGAGYQDANGYGSRYGSRYGNGTGDNGTGYNGNGYNGGSYYRRQG